LPIINNFLDHHSFRLRYINSTKAGSAIFAKFHSIQAATAVPRCNLCEFELPDVHLGPTDTLVGIFLLAHDDASRLRNL
jgi:hypothetical protein